MDYNKEELKMLKTCVEENIFQLEMDIRIHENCIDPDSYTSEEIEEYLEESPGWSPIQNYEKYKKEKENIY